MVRGGGGSVVGGITGCSGGIYLVCCGVVEKLLFSAGDGEDSVWVEEESSGRDEDKD